MTLRDQLTQLGLLSAVEEIAAASNVTIEQLESRSHITHFANARKLVYRMLRDLGWSFQGIGELFGRDNSTVQHALSGRRRPAIINAAGCPAPFDKAKLRGEEWDICAPFVNRMRQLSEERRAIVWAFVKEKMGG